LGDLLSLAEWLWTAWRKEEKDLDKKSFFFLKNAE
jgi:hypothetical protein